MEILLTGSAYDNNVPSLILSVNACKGLYGVNSPRTNRFGVVLWILFSSKITL